MNTLNIKSITRIVLENVRTGPTGNIATNEINDSLTYILIPYANAGNDAFIRAWVNDQSKWFLTVVNPNTGATYNNAIINVRYLVLKLYRNN